jgi:hypothetical protein
MLSINIIARSSDQNVSNDLLGERNFGAQPISLDPVTFVAEWWRRSPCSHVFKKILRIQIIRIGRKAPDVLHQCPTPNQSAMFKNHCLFCAMMLKLGTGEGLHRSSAASSGRVLRENISLRLHVRIAQPNFQHESQPRGRRVALFAPS